MIRVWITSYDEPDLLKLCVKSWHRYTNFPITIVDNFSSFKNSDVAASLAKPTNRINVYTLEKNIGHAAAMEKAATLVQEDKILFSDQDVEVLAPIHETDFSDADLEGVSIPAFVDPIRGYYTAPRIHTSFMLCKRKWIGRVPLQEFTLPFLNRTVRYDTAALLYNTLVQQGVDVKDTPNSLKQKFIHYFSDSSKKYFVEAPSDMADYFKRMREVTMLRGAGSDCDVSELRENFGQLWDKYCKPWELESVNNGN